MSGLSYQERSLWGSLVAEVVVYGVYFCCHHDNSVEKVAAMIFGIIVLQIVIQGVIAALTRNRMTDERDKVILLRGYRAGYFAVVTLMCLGLAALWFHTMRGDINIAHHNAGPHFLSGFFGILVISDVVKTVTQIVAYRRAL